MVNDFDNIAIVNQPDNLSTKLFKHQLANVYKMEQMEINNKIELHEEIKETTMGFLADITGSGKTLCIIGLICRNRMQWNTDLSYTVEKITCVANHKVKSHVFRRYQKLNCNLILASSSIIYQWVQEIEKSDLSCLVIETNKQIETEDINKYDIVITTPKFFNKLIVFYKNYAWKRFIFDEPGHIRVPAMKEIIAGFYWFVSATPEAIYYQHRNCRNSFMESIIEPVRYKYIDEVYEGLIIKNNDDFIKMSFKLPHVNYINYECYQPLHDVINGLVSPVIDKMLESGNIEGIINRLGGKKTTNIVELIKENKQKEIQKLTKQIEESTDDEKTKKINLQINTINEQIGRLEKRFSILLSQDCPICHNKLMKPVIEPHCQHVFCGKCILKWLKQKNTCPMCRQTTDVNNLVYIQDKNETLIKSENEQPLKTKTDVIVDLIKNKINNKFLIFSRYEGTFQTIIKILEDYNIKYSLMKGTSKKRKKIVDQYNNRDIQVIFLNSEHDGSGLNLQQTDDIIMYHELPEYYMKQIVGRAKRIGRTTELNVHILKLNQN